MYTRTHAVWETRHVKTFREKAGGNIHSTTVKVNQKLTPKNKRKKERKKY